MAGAGVAGAGVAGAGGLGAGGQASAGAAGSGGAIGIPLERFMIGADITWVQAAEGRGASYSDGTKRDIFQLLQAHGFNYIRLRTFVDPKAADGYDKQNGYADLAHTIAFGKRIKAAGLGFLVDFHYSDNWADPGKQCVPVAWQNFETHRRARGRRASVHQRRDSPADRGRRAARHGADRQRDHAGHVASRLR